ncbi:hypothetical protein Q7P37_010180 [Cladosporium fusiforme]
MIATTAARERAGNSSSKHLGADELWRHVRHSWRAPDMQLLFQAPSDQAAVAAMAARCLLGMGSSMDWCIVMPCAKDRQGFFSTELGPAQQVSTLRPHTPKEPATLLPDCTG